jgi:hypothetical protein
MSSNMIKTMLENWGQRSAQIKDQVNTEIQLNRDDLLKLEALAEVYNLPTKDLLANLINTSLKEVEVQMPYIPGDKVIRTEEGDPVYEDIGPTPAYLKAKARLEQKN